MNTIYKSLERTNADGLESHQIYALCEYVQSHLVPSVPCDASRVLLQMVVFAKGGTVTKLIERIYASIIAGSTVELEEFCILGECLVKLLELYRSCGAESFKGCQLELPFGDISCLPKKFSIAIKSSKSVIDLVSFWNNVVQSVYAEKRMMLALRRHHGTVLSTLVDLSSLLCDIDATAPMVITLCQATVAVVGSRHPIPCTDCIDSANPSSQIVHGLVSWVEYALSCTVKMITHGHARDGGVLNGQSFQPTEVKATLLSQMQKAMDHILAVVSSCVEHQLKHDAIAVVEVKMLVQRVGHMIESLVMPKRREITHAGVSELESFATVFRDKADSLSTAVNQPVTLMSSPKASNKNAVNGRGNGLQLQTSSGSPRTTTKVVPPTTTLTRPHATAECMLSSITVRLIAILQVFHASFPLEGPSLPLCCKMCVDIPCTHASLRLFSQHISESPELCSALCHAWCAPRSQAGSVCNSAANMIGELNRCVDSQDHQATLLKSVLAFEALMVVMLHAPHGGTVLSGLQAKRILSQFRALLTQSILSNDGGNSDTADPLAAAWMLLQCVSRLLDVSCVDTLVALLPRWIWKIVAAALDLTRSSVVGFAAASSSTNAPTAPGASTSNHNLAESISAATSPRAGQTPATSLDVAELESCMLRITTPDNSAVPALLPVRCTDDALEPFVLVWLRVLCLPASPVWMDATADSSTSAAAATVTSGAGASSHLPPAAGSKRGRVQDAESFDFFADQDCDADEPHNGNNSARKRLKKKKDSLPPAVAASTEQRASPSPSVSFGLLDHSEAFLSEFELQGSAAIVLISLVNQQFEGPTSPAGADSLAAVVEHVMQVVTRYLMDGAILSVALESALIKLMGLVVLHVVKLGQDRTGDLSAVYQYSDVARHLLQPSERLHLQSLVDIPEFAVFLAQFLSLASLQRSAQDASDATAGISTGASSVAVMAGAAVRLLQALVPHWEHAAQSILSTGRKASGGRAEADGEDGSELPESEPAMEVDEDSPPVGAGESSAAGDSGPGGSTTDLRVHAEFLLLHRTLLVTLYIAKQSLVSFKSTPLDAMIRSQDILLQKLIGHGVRSHVVILRLAQCLTVGMLAHLSSGQGAVSKVTDVPLVKTAISLLEMHHSERNSACKIATVGLCGFVKYATLLEPKDAVRTLMEVCLARSSTGEALGADVFSVELHALSEGGVLATLLVSNLSQVTEELLVPLLLSVGRSSATEEEIEIVDTLLHMLDRCTADHNNGSSLLDAARAAIFSKLAHLSDGAARSVGRLLRERKLDISAPTRYLLDENPSLFHQLLLDLSESDPSLAVAELLHQGHLSAALNNGARLFGVSVSETTDTTCMTSMTFHHALLPIVWSLGNSHTTLHEGHVRALQALCVQARDASWRQSTRTAVNVALSDREVKDVVADRLQSDFLYLMANLLLKDWALQSQAYQEQSLCCFRHLVFLLKQSDLIKFLPKILIVVDSALGGASAKVRLAAVHLTAALYPRLPVDVMGEHLSSLVVPLFPLLEAPAEVDETPGSSHPTSAANTCVTASSALSATQAVVTRDSSTTLDTAFPSRASATMMAFSPQVQLAGADLQVFGKLGRGVVSTVSQNESGLLARVLDVVFAQENSRKCTAEIHRVAVGIIKDLFIDQRESVQKYTQSVAYIPDIPALKTVHDLHQQEVKAISLDQSLRLLCEMLTHASSHVRYVAVNRLTMVCREHKEQLNRVLELTTDSSATTATEHIVSTVLQVLLRMCAHEPDRRVQDACAKCLGELGAVDPSRVSVRLSKPPPMSSAEGKPGEASAFPWHVRPQDLGLYLLEHHLVPGLRSADGSASQDKSGFAIQVILKQIASAYDESTGATSVPPTASASMPEALKDLLASKSILDVTEPFWSTSYTMNENYPVRVPPIYFHGLSFARWISLFTRYLICNAKGPLSPIFTACRGVVRIRSELCQYLLPHLIYDVLTQSASEVPATKASAGAAVQVPRSAADAIMQEICLVLRGCLGDSSTTGTASTVAVAPSSPRKEKSSGSGTSQSDQMCIQSIFSLFDTLSSWVTRCAQKSGFSYPRGRFQRGLNVYSCRTYEMEKNGIACVKSLVDAVPKELLSKAAMDIKAHTRALRYIELHARDVQRQQHFCGVQLKVEGYLDYDDLYKQCETGIVAKWQTADPSAHTAEFHQMTILCADRAGGELPILSAEQLESYMSIYASLEDPDSLQGALVMNHVYGHSASLWHRILELELTDNWLGALLEYGFVHNSQRFSNSLHHYIRNSKSAAVKNESIASSGTGKSATSTSGAMDVVQDAATEAESGALMSMEEIVELERRKLRCMVELGHFEAVIDQTTAMASRLSELEKSLLPLGTEAAWRLMRWDDLDAFLGKYEHSTSSSGTVAATAAKTGALMLPALEADRFQLSVGRLLLCLQKQDKTSFDAELENARTQTMSSLSAASMESYGRAYPMLTRLHALHELQCGYDLLLRPHNNTSGNAKSSTSSASAGAGSLHEKAFQALRWEDRLKYMSPSVPQRSTLLAVRRCILGVCGLPNLVAQNWLELSHSMRQLGKFDSARLAVRNAQSYGLDAESVLLQECRILRDSGEVSRALMMLEPVEVDLVAIKTALKNAKKGAPLPAYLDSEQKRIILSERISLATQLMVDSRQKQGNSITSRYNTVIALNKMWPQAYFDLAKYHEFLYHDSKTKLQQSCADYLTLNDAPAVAAGTTGAASATSKAAASAAQRLHQLLLDTQVMCNNLLNAIEMFGNSIILGVELAMQVLPRMLTLWLSFTAQQDLLTEAAASSATATASVKRSDTAAILQKCQSEANECMAKICAAVPPSTWYVCMSQLVSRVLHRNEDTVKLLVTILLKILAKFPKQGIWHIAALMFSFNTDRKKVAKKLLQDTYKTLQAAKSLDAQMLVDSQKVCQNLVSLAAHQCKERRIRWPSVPGVKLDVFLVPSQAVLHHTNPLRMLELSSAEEASGAGAGNSNYYTSNQMFIASFNETVDVASSKAKPKTISLLTVCGKTVRFLCKQEKDGDLRKDARLMEFNTAVNRLLTEDPEGRKRHLRLRTYAVVCLNEECGILEWVNNTDCLRQLITKSHSYWPDFYPPLSYKDVFQDFVDVQTKHEDDLAKMMHFYARLLAQHNYHPCFHRWFLEQFPDPTAWQEARSNFVRSAAVWSAVGHVIGLGDRHTENILLDVTNGEMVHVDFDCLFDKGLTLLRPEIVPFRLTPNIVDAMGVTGVEGTFRRTMEVTMSVLRENKDTLLSVLEPFLRDPTVSWSRSGRAQRNTDGSTTSTTTAGVKGRDHENKEAKEMLLKISERLNGVYNIAHPHREKFLRGASKRGELAPVRGIGVSKDEMLPLSVQGQVQRLIDEATAPENLVQMYIGWQPWV